MKRFFTIVGLAAVALGPAFAGCSCGADIVGNGNGDGTGGPVDASRLLPPGDLFGLDLTQGLNACGDTDPGCMTNGFGPPQKQFPLQSDPQPDPHESDTGVDRDNNGYIVLSTSHTNFDFVWIANMYDWNIGTVSKISSKKVQETARYMTVTCYSNPGGGRAACDGTNGCCSKDDNVGFNNRRNNMPSGPHQAIQNHDNHPSRTAVDFNGDMWVSNRAFGGQSSVTKIANDMTECTERNGTPGIQTSSDVDGNGVIDTDCNQNMIPDDVADVKQAPCTNGKAQEFYGFDDECILFTTNTNQNNMWGRPLALGQGSVDFGPSDAWAGGFNNGLFFRIDGATGMTKAQAQVGSSPYGATVDGSGILWADEVSGPNLYYFDTNNPQNSATARVCSFGENAYGITLDRDQNVWVGGYPDGNAYRYTPDRSNGFASLGNGYWTKILNPGGVGNVGRGIAADSRTQGDYWVWMGRHDNYIIRIPASKIPVPKGADVQIDGTNQAMGFLAIPVAGTAPAGAGVDTDQNIWGISSGGSVATRIKVDVNGNVTMPNLAGCGPGSACPGAGGDCCALQYVHPNGGSTNPDPYPYTYSDFTGFGLRNFTNPQGSYSYIQTGCGLNETHWVNVVWDADVPPNTTLTMRARSGQNPIPDNSWGAWTGDYTMSPSDLKGMPGPVMPNPAPYMQVEFDLKSMDKAATPRLKSFYIDYECGNMIM
jgi:hypothetical protein